MQCIFSLQKKHTILDLFIPLVTQRKPNLFISTLMWLKQNCQQHLLYFWCKVEKNILPSFHRPFIILNLTKQYTLGREEKQSKSVKSEVSFCYKCIISCQGDHFMLCFPSCLKDKNIFINLQIIMQYITTLKQENHIPF